MLLLMNDPGQPFQWLWHVFLIHLIWLWSIRYWFLAIGMISWCQWMIKDAVRSGVEEALKKTVTPVLDDIYDKLTENEAEE